MAATILRTESRKFEEVYNLYFDIEIEEAKTLYFVYFRQSEYTSGFYHTEKVSKKQAKNIDEAIKVAFEQYTADKERCSFKVWQAKQQAEAKKEAYVEAVLQAAAVAEQKQCSKAAAADEAEAAVSAEAVVVEKKKLEAAGRTAAEAAAAAGTKIEVVIAGKAVAAAAGCYIVQYYAAGWQNKAVFASNQLKQAEKYMNLQNCKNVQIIQLY